MTNAPPNRFLWLYDRITETEMSGMQIAVMFVLLARDEAGLRAITKSEIGALVGVSDRQVTTVLTQLERDLSLIKTQRNGGTGKGRVANSYLVRPDANGSEVPVAWGNKKPSSGNQLPVTVSNQQSSSGSELPVAGNAPEISGSHGGSVLPVACGEILPPIKHAHARVENNLLTKSKILELNSETLSVCVAREMPVGGGELDMDWTLSAENRAFANERGFLNGSCDELFGQFLDHCNTRGPRMSQGWRSEWRRWVRNQVKFDEERARRANNPEAKNDQRPSHSYASAGKRRARSVETEILMRDILDRPPST